MKYLVCLILCLGFAATTFAEDETAFSVVLTSGKELTWQSLFVDGDFICTYKSGGTFCVSKADVVSYKEKKVSSTFSGSSASTASSGSSSSPSSDGQGRREGETYNGTFTGRAKYLEKLLEK